MKRSKYFPLFFVLLLCLLLTTPCKKAIYVPSEGDIIQLSADTTIMVPGATITITVTGVKSTGSPMPDNTLVLLSADSGEFLNPQGVKTVAVRLTSGKATAKYRADENFTGEEVTITAQSGTAVVSPEALVITIRSVAVATLFMTADTLSLPPSGGTAQIEVTAYDSQQDVVVGEKIFLETTAGTLTPESPIISDDDGKITAALTTTEAATVTATYKEITNSILIDVGINVAPVAGFEFSPQNPTNGDTIYFTSTSSDEEDGTGITHSWVFGDSTSSTEVNPTHVYPTVTEDTEFKVVLTVTDSEGKTASVAQSVTITLVPNELPVADFIFSPENPGIGNAVYFTSLSTDSDGTIESYEWNFGDGSFSSAENPIHTYSPAEPAIFNIKLTVTDDQGGTGTVTQQITVGNYDNVAPTAAFAWSPEEPVEGGTVRFTSTSIDEDGTVVSYYWELGDNTTSTKQNPTHVYNSAGTFQVTLTVTDNGGLTGTVTQPVTVIAETNEPPVAAFTYSPKDPKDGDTVWFNASSSTDSDGTIVEYQWDFGDGVTFTGTTINASHTYYVTKEETYTVTLTVVDDDGDQGTVSQEITVAVPEAGTSNHNRHSGIRPHRPLEGDRAAVGRIK